MSAAAAPFVVEDAPWCGHDGDYLVIAFFCGRPVSRSDQLVECTTCGRQYFGSELAAWRRAAAADPADRCDHLLLRSDCDHCRPRKPRKPRQPKPDRPDVPDGAFAARYGGRCAGGCGERIEPGQWITRRGGGYAHVGEL